jgi:TonB family protein
VNPKHNKLFWSICGAHLGMIVLLIVVPFVRGFFRPKPAELSVSVAIVDSAQVAPQANPAPAPQPTPQPIEPEPEPEPEPAPAPAPAPKPKEPEWKPAKVIRQNNRVTRQTATPTSAPQQQPDLNTVKNALRGSVDLFSSYYQRVLARYYAVWQQPTTAPFGTQAVALITVAPDGTILSKEMSQPSGVAVFDRSVEAALGRVSGLPAPPADLPSRTISVTFVLSN